MTIQKAEGSFDPGLFSSILHETAAYVFGFVLDQSPESLQTIDKIGNMLHWREDTPPLTSTVEIMGGYIGEVFKRTFNGDWYTGEGMPPTVIWGEPKDGLPGSHSYTPGIAAYKLIHEGGMFSVWTSFNDQLIKMRNEMYGNIG